MQVYSLPAPGQRLTEPTVSRRAAILSWVAAFLLRVQPLERNAAYSLSLGASLAGLRCWRGGLAIQAVPNLYRTAREPGQKWPLLPGWGWLCTIGR